MADPPSGGLGQEGTAFQEERRRWQRDPVGGWDGVIRNDTVHGAGGRLAVPGHFRVFAGLRHLSAGRVIAAQGDGGIGVCEESPNRTGLGPLSGTPVHVSRSGTSSWSGRAAVWPRCLRQPMAVPSANRPFTDAPGGAGKAASRQIRPAGPGHFPGAFHAACGNGAHLALQGKPESPLNDHTIPRSEKNAQFAEFDELIDKYATRAAYHQRSILLKSEMWVILESIEATTSTLRYPAP
ncbi:hypothetical protein [Kitasatospora cystarginea]|uniref:hypothetical protein n=1 Tax=Kitasatospora cystarginea TaxID=58350 RepID=UPI0031CF563A